MSKSEDSGSPGWSASFFMPTKEDVARAVAAAATAVHSPRPSAVYSLKGENTGSRFQKLQHHVSRVLKGFSQSSEVRLGTYDPEILTSQKRQWASFQLQYLDHRSYKEPSTLFESMVVVGLPPSCDVQALQRQYVIRQFEGSGKLRSALSCQNSSRVEPCLEPQVLFLYPPEKQLPLKYKDLLSFCFPGGIEVHAVRRTPSMSELNEILLSQEHLKQSDLSFVFRLQITSYGSVRLLIIPLCMDAVLVEELVQKPSGLLSLTSDRQPAYPSLSRYVMTTRRCYCILSRLPCFELHFGVLNSIFDEERLERLTKSIGDINLELPEDYSNEANMDDALTEQGELEDTQNEMTGTSEISSEDSKPGGTDDGNIFYHQMLERDFESNKVVNRDSVVTVDLETETFKTKKESSGAYPKDCDTDVDDFTTNRQTAERHMPNAVLPFLRYYQYESSESSCSFQGSPCDNRNLNVDDTETEEASISGQEDSSDHLDILEWAKANNHGSLQILYEYYRLQCPARGSKLRFHPLEHLHPLEYYRPDEQVLHIAGSTVDLRSCSTSLEFAEAHTALLAEEEATALSTWAVACMCGSLRLEHVLTIFAAALLEKQIAVVCSNLVGDLICYSSVNCPSDPSIPMAKPLDAEYMLDFLDAPVPYIVGVKNKTSEVQSKLANVILADANKNQIKASTIPQLPQHKELFACLSPYHAKLVGESYLGRKRPVYECTDVQIEAAEGFLSVLRSYLDSLCSNMRSHTITNVQSNNDKVCVSSN
ncbi:DENN domain-containing protein isoform 2 [Hibiscus syriacus]|uniref:DENN domain-containing protein isoform 2 n=1 Tax=Hibiscus syriacus TaxID=106335 RepID=A0A6A3BY81_HIBSY|nr:DENN domain-containing protein isoform 2 [Hibiscus syriacus]